MRIDIKLINELIGASIRLATPLMLASAGGLLSELSGVINIGIEGAMLVGAFVAVVISATTGNVLLATLGACIIGGLLALIHSYITITRRANQIVTGAGIILLSIGTTNFLNSRFSATIAERARVEIFPRLSPAFFRELPILGPLFFNQPVIVWIAFLTLGLTYFVLYKTSWGLSVRAVGENSRAVATAGQSVVKIRYLTVLASGFSAGLAGCALSLMDLGYFVQNMSAGKGFIVLAAMAVGRWNPIWVGAACILFGAGEAIQLRMQAFGSVIPYQFLTMLPYLLTIIVMAGVVGKADYPKEVGKAYNPEEE